jgi:hypothetical protein
MPACIPDCLTAQYYLEKILLGGKSIYFEGGEASAAIL